MVDGQRTSSIGTAVRSVHPVLHLFQNDRSNHSLRVCLCVHPVLLFELSISRTPGCEISTLWHAIGAIHALQCLVATLCSDQGCAATPFLSFMNVSPLSLRTSINCMSFIDLRITSVATLIHISTITRTIDCITSIAGRRAEVGLFSSAWSSRGDKT